MFTYAKIALVFLQLAEMLVNLARSKQQMEAGADAEIAKAAAAVLVKTESAKKIMQELTSMTEEQVDQTLKGLEP